MVRNMSMKKNTNTTADLISMPRRSSRCSTSVASGSSTVTLLRRVSSYPSSLMAFIVSFLSLSFSFDTITFTFSFHNSQKGIYENFRICLTIHHFLLPNKVKRRQAVLYHLGTG